MSETDTDEVFRLIYSSHSLIDSGDKSGLGAIFNSARKNNQRLGVTGALVTSSDHFVQTLEGDEGIVRDLYAKISEDPRHDQLTLLETRTVPGRTFGRWAMARVSEDGGPDIRMMSNAKHGTIVEVPGGGSHVTPEQQEVLGFMRGAAVQGAEQS